MDAHEYFQGIVSQLQGQGENVAGVGDEAYFHSQGPNGEVLDVRQGQVVVAVQFSHPNPGTCTVDQAKAQAVLIAQKTLDLAK